MNAIGKKFVSAALLTGLALPASALAADEVQQKLDALQKEMDALKLQVKKTEDKSMEKWLTIGGDYRFRIDSLRGTTVAYTDAFGTLNNAQSALQNYIFSGQAPTAALSALNGLVQTMRSTTSYSAASAMVSLLNNPSAPPQYANMQALAAALMNPSNPEYYGNQRPASKPSNDTLYTNRFGLDLHAKATQNVTVNVRMLAYKTFGSNDDSAVTGSGGTPYFADRVGVFDGTLGHIPSSDYLNLDRGYVTWSNIADQPIWFSVGRRPSTNGIPEHLRLNNERPGNGGTPALLVDYAFDGMTIGYAPDIEMLPGAYAKVCYGRGFESGVDNGNSLKDTDMLGVAVVPVDTDPLRVHFQWNRGFNIFDFATMDNTYFGNTSPSIDLGDIDWYGTGVLSKLKKVGPGNLNLFGEFGLSVTHPNQNVSGNAGFQGLMTGAFFNPEAPTSKTGWAAYLGARYDYEPTKTKLGFEYNHGSKNWITFAPAADDMWTSKVGTRGDVYETYLIQELNLKPISSYLSKVFFKVGYQYYNFEYTGSNNWVGAPVKIDDIKSTDMLLMTPLKNAQNIYGTFEVKF